MDFRKLIAITKPLRIAFNMLCCATLLAWAGPKPRETVSGLIGRKSYVACVDYGTYDIRYRFWRAFEWLIDVLHRREEMHCYSTYQLEWRAREILGYDE